MKIHFAHAFLYRTILTRQPSWRRCPPTQSLLRAPIWQNPTTQTSNSSQMYLPVSMSTSISLATGALLLQVENLLWNAPFWSASALTWEKRMTLEQACGLISLAQRWYWNYSVFYGFWRHSCSQVMPFCYDGTNDMFEAQAWDMDQYTKDCQQTWGVTPR